MRLYVYSYKIDSCRVLTHHVQTQAVNDPLFVLIVHCVAYRVSADIVIMEEAAFMDQSVFYEGRLVGACVPVTCACAWWILNSDVRCSPQLLYRCWKWTGRPYCASGTCACHAGSPSSVAL